MRIELGFEEDWHLTTCIKPGCGQVFLSDDYSETYCKKHELEQKGTKIELDSTDASTSHRFEKGS